MQGHTLDELPFRALGGIWASWISGIILVLVLIAQFYIVSSCVQRYHSSRVSIGSFRSSFQAIWPIGGNIDGTEAAENFFLAYLAAPVMIAFYIVGVIWKRTTPRKASSIDLVSGRKAWATAEELEPGRRAVRELPWPKWIVYILFGVRDLSCDSLHLKKSPDVLARLPFIQGFDPRA